MPLSPRAVAAALAPETTEREVYLLTLTHPAWSAPLRLSTDPTVWLRNHPETGEPMYGTVSRGMTFEYLPISVAEPDSRDESPPAGRLSLDNVSRLVSPYVMMVDNDYPRVTVELVLADEPDVVDQTWPELDVQKASVNLSSVDVEVGMNTAASESMPWLRFVPAYFPNLFD